MSKFLIQPSMMKWSQNVVSLCSFARCSSSHSSNTWSYCPKLRETKGNPPVCRSLDLMRPKYFKAPPNCKSDEELSKLNRKILGIPRCKPTLVLNKDCDAELYDPCKLDRMDTLYYKPSRSLDREFEKYWVECVYQKRPKRRCYTKPVEFTRRGPRKAACGWLGNASKCKVLFKMACTKMSKVSTAASDQCIKYPLCECPKASKNTRCRLLPKPGKCRRRLTRYPSFSECLNDPLSPVKLNECKCLQSNSLCDLWKAYKNFRRPC